MNVGASGSHGEMRPDAPFETHLGRVIRRLDGFTGVLEVEAGGEVTTFYVRDGVVGFADGSAIGDALGGALVAQGVLDEDEHAAIVRRMTDAIVDSEAMRFGEVALELGLLTAADLSSALGGVVRALLLRALALDEGRWSARADEEAVLRVAHYPCALVPATFEALTGAAPLWREHLVLLGFHAALLRPETAQLGLPPEMLRLARSLDGTKSIETMLGSDTRGEEKRIGGLATLLALDLAELLDAPRPKKSLRPPRTSTRSRKRPVLPPEPAPPPPAPAPAAPPVTSATERAVAIREELARGRPAAPPPAPRAPEPRPRMTAEQAHAIGRRALADGRLPAAVKHLEEAAQSPEATAEHRLAAAFACWLAAKDAAAREVERMRLEAATADALKADRRSAFAHYANGRLAHAKDDLEAAAKSLTNAARLDPDDVEIARWARHVGPPKKPPKK